MALRRAIPSLIMHWPFRKKLGVGLGLAFTLWVVVGFIAISSLNSYVEANRLRLHSMQVKNALDTVYSDIQDVETGQRGYLLTDDVAYLEPFYRSVEHIRANLQQLKRLTQDNDQHQELLPKLEQLINSKLETSAVSIRLQHARQSSSALQLILSGQGKQQMDEFRDLVARMEGVEDRLMEQRETLVARRNRTMVFYLYCSGLLSILLLVSLYRLVHHEIGRRENAESQLQEINENLETLVAERTGQLEQSNRLLQNYTRKLEQSNQELEQFASVASHDLQTPLRKVIFFSTALKDSAEDKLSPEDLDHLDRIVSASVKMQNLVTDLLNLSRVTKRGGEFRQVKLRSVIEETAGDLLHETQLAQGEIRIGDFDIALNADPGQLGQLFQNLISNALKFRRPGVPPVVEINAALADNGQCEITVADNGIGFDEKYSERIFQVFERLHTDSEYQGTGIGLAICQKIVERHKGAISVRSVPGEGTTFTVTLPVIATPA